MAPTAPLTRTPETGAQDYLVDHSTYIYLMDPQGKFVRGFDAETPETASQTQCARSWRNDRTTTMTAQLDTGKMGGASWVIARRAAVRPA